MKPGASKRRPAWLRLPKLPRVRWHSPVVLGVLGVLLLAGAAVLVTPGVFSRPTPLGQEDVGSRARKDYRASRDFTYTELDPVATETKRSEAARAVLPVYDFDLEERERVVQQIRASFGSMRDLLAEYDSRARALEAEFEGPAPRPPAPGAAVAPPDAGRPDAATGPATPEAPSEPPAARARSAKPGGDAHPQPATADPAALLEKRRRELSSWLQRQLEQKRPVFYRTLHQTLAPEEYLFLRAQSFSKDLEGRLVYLVSTTLQKKVMASSGGFKYHREGGLRLRVKRGPTAVEEVDVKEDFSEFVTVGDALERLVPLARRRMKDVDPQIRDRLVDIAGRLVVPNCRYNRIETDARRSRARESVQSLVSTRALTQGEVIVAQHRTIEPLHVAIVHADLKGYQGEGVVLELVGNALLILALCATLLVFFGRNVRKFAPARRDLAFIGLWSLLNLAAFRVGVFVTAAMAESWQVIPADAYLYLLPVAASAMLVRMVVNSETAAMVAVLNAAMVGIATSWNLPVALFGLVSGLAGAGGVGRAKQRVDLLRAGLITGLVNVAFVVGARAALGSLLRPDTLAYIGLAALGGMLAGLVVTAVLPLVEILFSYTTNIKLLELANLNNPLLKELAIRAPGTFHHSILVGNLVEAAAEAIRANPLLARVGAYYHDVGKIKAPHYFAENQRPGQNPHDKLRPSMSSLVLKEHVRDGAKLLRSRRYPRLLADICEQHAGTTLISFFYHKAKELAEERSDPPPLETDYRYAGPKPQTREAALVFLGDSVEAAAKSLPDPSPARLQGLVQNLINARFIDGQLSECDLTLGDLHRIARAFIRGLTGIYHSRPEYPGGGGGRRREDTGGHRRTHQSQTLSKMKSLPGQAAASGPRSRVSSDGAAGRTAAPPSDDNPGGEHTPTPQSAEEQRREPKTPAAGASGPEPDAAGQAGERSGESRGGGRPTGPHAAHVETPSLRRLGSIEME